MQIRDVEPADWAQVWPFYEQVVRAGETYMYDTDLSEDAARSMWLLPAPDRTVVAVDGERVLGTAKMNPNYGGNGAGVASASFLVDASARCRGVGRALGEETLRWARAEGYRAMVFNAVVSTNAPAVHLWRSLGFSVIATVPEAFDHPVHGLVGLHVMHQQL